MRLASMAADKRKGYRACLDDRSFANSALLIFSLHYWVACHVVHETGDKLFKVRLGYGQKALPRRSVIASALFMDCVSTRGDRTLGCEKQALMALESPH
ncbi:hypothetical protein EAW52_03330 [Pseudomonas sp. LTJR-52]|nr:hypothetical protein EAW52_03330 [Pseudomonas sp. LTJR-52]